MMTAIGLIGVGMMGHGIASNLAAHGFPLTVLDHPGNQPLDALLKAGVRTAKRPVDVALACDVLILCVTGSPQVEMVLTGPDGAIEGLGEGDVVIDCSTALPNSTVRLSAAVHERGARMLDAAMTRTPREAAQGRLNLLIGGEADLLERCRPVLASFAESITHAGPIGSGHRMKLLHKFVSLGQFTLLAEAAACARIEGIDADVFLDVIAGGGGGGTALERLRPYLTDNDMAGMRFAIANACKDLSYYTTMANEAGAGHTVADSVLATLTTAREAGDPAALMPQLVDILAARRGN